MTLAHPDGTASGSFVYDADTNTYSNIDITTTAFTFLLNDTPISVPGQHYTTLYDGTNSYLRVQSSDPAGLTLIFAHPLTNAGGTVGFAPMYPPVIQIGHEYFFTGESIATSKWAPPSGGPLVMRDIPQGSVTTVAPVGVPALSPTGLAVLGIFLVGCAATLLRTGTRTEA